MAKNLIEIHSRSKAQPEQRQELDEHGWEDGRWVGRGILVPQGLSYLWRTWDGGCRLCSGSAGPTGQTTSLQALPTAPAHSSAKSCWQTLGEVLIRSLQSPHSSSLGKNDYRVLSLRLRCHLLQKVHPDCVPPIEQFLRYIECGG